MHHSWIKTKTIINNTLRMGQILLITTIKVQTHNHKIKINIRTQIPMLSITKWISKISNSIKVYNHPMITITMEE